MARAPLTAVMKAKYFVKLAEKGKLPKNFAEEYGSTPEKFFRCIADLKAQYTVKGLKRYHGEPSASTATSTTGSE